MEEPDDSPMFKEAVDVFIDSTEDEIANNFRPVKTCYDLRLRNLSSGRMDLKPGKGYGIVPEWQGASGLLGYATIWDNNLPAA